MIEFGHLRDDHGHTGNTMNGDPRTNGRLELVAAHRVQSLLATPGIADPDDGEAGCLVDPEQDDAAACTVREGGDRASQRLRQAMESGLDLDRVVLICSGAKRVEQCAQVVVRQGDNIVQPRLSHDCQILSESETSVQRRSA